MVVKKIFAYFTVLAGITALVLSTSKSLSEHIKVTRSCLVNRPLWWGEQNGIWGDLTSMSYLGRIKKFCAPKDYAFDSIVNTQHKDIDLYLYGDSYVAEIPRGAFANVDHYFYHYRYDDRDYTLDRKKKNILIIEASERFVRERFRTAALLQNMRVKDEPDTVKAAANAPLQKKTVVNTLFSVTDLFNPHINQNLEYHLFNYNFLILPRQVKAAVTYTLFNRASGDVVISDDGKFLFYKITVMQNNLCSSFDQLGSNEVSTIVASLDTIYDHYKQVGFDEVYFSAIPNPASILQPAPYNKLIPLIQNDPKMKMPLIDLYTSFTNCGDAASLYRAGDTHWNNKGMQLWLQKVNNILRKESRSSNLANSESHL
jgi:hypothetical protein